ncbi:helix-turn-helix transcriptional regulator [Pseudoruegeria sp. SHC-113]|uniref:helix-turn-helix transcriptional regulator n=1 Tax=Pseudoruegeria sp. SHC-113 TaxID=2855439 RepID=UPI0021BB9F61|nr:AraC family transcriptional regulator [Pseudoruegeria sp. SHC-113]MCT8161588.1 AraC family transcriptional regulator [Pseudoruegeria sp. SHC-113]
MAQNSKPTVPVQRLAHLVSCLDDFTGSPRAAQAILDELDVKREALRIRDGQVETLSEARFCQMACALEGMADFAVRAGLCFQNSQSLTVYIAKYSKDLKTAIEAASRYHVLVDPTTVYWLQTTSSAGHFQTRAEDGEIARMHHHREFLLFSALATMRQITQVSFFPLEIRFRHAAGASAEAIQRKAGCAVEFATGMDEIILAPSTLNLDIPTFDPALRDHLTDYGNLLLSRSGGGKMDLRARIEKLLLDGLPGRLPSADEVAANLGMSRRTFARRLSDNGISFREIVDGLREDIARSYLRDGLAISEVAYVLDYSDQAAFTTAFKRWTGLTPKAFALQASAA